MSQHETLDETDRETLDAKLAAYRSAVEAWVATIRDEESLAGENHSVAEIDNWEAAHFREERARQHAKDAKRDYESALREKFFGFS